VVSRYTRYFFSDGTLAAAPPKGGGADSVVWAQPTQPGSTVTYDSAPLARGATIAGPAAVTAYASSSNANIELMADLYDVAPDGSATKITHGGILGSLRATDATRSWTDDAGLPVRPYLSLQKDEVVPPGASRYDIPLHPKVWALPPGHALRLMISTQAPEQSCLESMQKIVWPVLGCKPRPAILATLAGGTYAIERGGVHASSITLPLLPLRALPAARSSATPTSGGVVLPRDW
jgi:predicted acyl esterase